jgi:hypothetical protein
MGCPLSKLNIHQNIIVLQVTGTSLSQCHCEHFHQRMIYFLHELPPGGHGHLFHSYHLTNSTF